MTNAEFQCLMEKIDAQLKKDGVPIHARPLHATRYVSERLKTKIIVAQSSAPAISGRYDELTLGEHIHEWFSSRYGERLKIHFGPGSVGILIRGEVWCLTLPKIYGEIIATCDSDLERFRKSPKICTGGQRPVCNVLNCIKDFPQGMATELTITERKQILAFFTHALDSLELMKCANGKPYIREALADIESAVSNLCGYPPQYGLSKWDSLQVAEKVMKSYLHIHNMKVPKHHDLADIAAKAQAKGLLTIPSALLNCIQCIAGVRYGEVTVTLEEAIDAHYASLEVCKLVVPSLG